MLDQQLRNYKILKQLGEGGMATVYLAEHLDLGHSVAIKILNKEFTYNQNIRNRFIDEAKKMVRMNHINVVKVTDLINEPDTVAIVMEYVDGETLRDLLSRKNKLSDTEIENYLKQMVSALEYVHKQGLVHRDIKPSNFIFNQDGILKLTDFGISKNLSGDLDGHTQTSTALSLGTPMYMSPEQVRSTKDVTHLSDIYSLGVVLWEMVAGKKPYDLNTLSSFDLMTKVVNETLSLTGTNWDRMIQKATQKEEGKRFESISNFVAAIDTMTSSSQIGKVEESVVDFEKTIVTEKSEVKKNVKEKRSSKTFFDKVKQKKYLLLAGVLLISIFIIVFQCNKEAAATANQSYHDAERKAKEENARLKKADEKAKEEEIRLKQSEEKAKEEAKRLKAFEEKAKDEEKRLKKLAKEREKSKIEFIRIGNLEVMTKDLGKMNWWDANKACEAFGDGWRLPTKEELKFLRTNQTVIGGFASSDYWSSSEYSSTAAYYVGFYGGSNAYGKDFDGTRVRAVRSF